jgi:hypothetical protein
MMGDDAKRDALFAVGDAGKRDAALRVANDLERRT